MKKGRGKNKVTHLPGTLHLLRARCDRPRGRRAAEQRYELAASE
jgi:hypothetical protein